MNLAKTGQFHFSFFKVDSKNPKFNFFGKVVSVIFWKKVQILKPPHFHHFCLRSLCVMINCCTSFITFMKGIFLIASIIIFKLSLCTSVNEQIKKSSKLFWLKSPIFQQNGCNFKTKIIFWCPLTIWIFI